MSIEGKAKEAAGFVKEELNERNRGKFLGVQAGAALTRSGIHGIWWPPGTANLSPRYR
jgi:hypothetical protein